MKKIKSLKLFAGIAMVVEVLTLITVIVVLSVQKKSVPKALIAALAAGSVLSAVLLISHRRDEARGKRLREMDAFYDYDYEAYASPAGAAQDVDYDED